MPDDPPPNDDAAAAAPPPAAAAATEGGDDNNAKAKAEGEPPPTPAPDTPAPVAAEGGAGSEDTPAAAAAAPGEGEDGAPPEPEPEPVDPATVTGVVEDEETEQFVARILLEEDSGQPPELVVLGEFDDEEEARAKLAEAQKEVDEVGGMAFLIRFRSGVSENEEDGTFEAHIFVAVEGTGGREGDTVELGVFEKITDADTALLKAQIDLKNQGSEAWLINWKSGIKEDEENEKFVSTIFVAKEGSHGREGEVAHLGDFDDYTQATMALEKARRRIRDMGGHIWLLQHKRRKLTRVRKDQETGLFVARAFVVTEEGTVGELVVLGEFEDRTLAKETLSRVKEEIDERDGPDAWLASFKGVGKVDIAAEERERARLAEEEAKKNAKLPAFLRGRGSDKVVPEMATTTSTSTTTGDEAKGDEAKGDEAKGDEAKGDEAKGDETKGEEEAKDGDEESKGEGNEDGDDDGGEGKEGEEELEEKIMYRAKLTVTRGRPAKVVEKPSPGKPKKKKTAKVAPGDAAAATLLLGAENVDRVALIAALEAGPQKPGSPRSPKRRRRRRRSFGFGKEESKGGGEGEDDDENARPLVPTGTKEEVLLGDFEFEATARREVVDAFKEMDAEGTEVWLEAWRCITFDSVTKKYVATFYVDLTQSRSRLEARAKAQVDAEADAKANQAKAAATSSSTGGGEGESKGDDAGGASAEEEAMLAAMLGKKKKKKVSFTRRLSRSMSETFSPRNFGSPRKKKKKEKDGDMVVIGEFDKRSKAKEEWLKARSRCIALGPEVFLASMQKSASQGAALKFKQRVRVRPKKQKLPKWLEKIVRPRSKAAVNMGWEKEEEDEFRWQSLLLDDKLEVAKMEFTQSVKGVLFGSPASGKTTLLQQLNVLFNPEWDDKVELPKHIKEVHAYTIVAVKALVEGVETTETQIYAREDAIDPEPEYESEEEEVYELTAAEIQQQLDDTLALNDLEERYAAWEDALELAEAELRDAAEEAARVKAEKDAKEAGASTSIQRMIRGKQHRAKAARRKERERKRKEREARARAELERVTMEQEDSRRIQRLKEEAAGSRRSGTRAQSC